MSVTLNVPKEWINTFMFFDQIWKIPTSDICIGIFLYNDKIGINKM